MTALLCALNGALFGFSLIVAIGPQNTYVLRKGLAGRHVAAVVMVCVASDAALITLGAAGVGPALSARPAVIEIVRFAGAGFLMTYAFVAIRRATQGQELSVVGIATAGSAWGSVSTCLAFTWLNPHVYLDTVVLLGAVASTQAGNASWFASGAIVASTIWFTALGFGARFLRPLFARPNAIRLLDVVIAMIMLSIGLSLVYQGVNS